MRNTGEIIRLLNQRKQDANKLLDEPLWPRFQKVRNAIVHAVTNPGGPEVRRDLQTFHWGGYDNAIHDHSGKIEGQIGQIHLKIGITGSTIENQPHVVAKPDGQWTFQYQREQFLEISGTFISPDGLRGAVQLQIGNTEPTYEAYWLQFVDGRFRLEQVVNPEQKTFDANSLDTERDSVTIPGTRITLPRFIK